MFLCLLQGCVLMAQHYSVSGRVLDVENNPLSFVNILVFEEGSETIKKGTTTDDDGTFVLEGIAAGNYKFHFSYIGFESLEETIEVSTNKNLGSKILHKRPQLLDETVVRANLPTIKKTAGKLVFNIENTSFSTGSTMDLLKKTPGVVVIGENIQVKFTTPLVFINEKRVYLSASEIAALLENTDASTIKSIEVITNPSAKYDAEAGTVLNIITSKAISIGYKGSVNATYEQEIYPKSRLGTAHFYKNNWLNAYASYTYGKRKEYKEDESYIRFFQPDGVSTKMIMETDFNRKTNYDNHNGNAVLDFNLDERNTISLTSNISLSPKVDYNNRGESIIYDPQRLVDSTSTTVSHVNFEKDNLTFALDYNRKLNNDGASVSVSANYIYYDNLQNQQLSSDYLLANGDFLRNRSFQTNSEQNSNIFTGQADISTELWGGTFLAGLKYSNVDTHSKLDFFNVANNNVTFSESLSDDFNYKENIYAEYINYEKEWEKWSITAGLRGEYTDIDAISRSLGQVDNKNYFDLFPSASFHYSINDNNGIGVSYSRNIERPRYQSLNPFRYYITERNFNGGNPNLVPAVEDKITLAYDYKDKLFFKLYYQNVQHGLEALTFQNNTNNTFETIDANLIRAYQYSFDITYFSSLNPWWWIHVETSSFYLANEFYALQSTEKKYNNDTFGQYIFSTNHFTISKERSFTADLTGFYLSNFVFGNRYFKNRSYVNVSIRKEFWDKRASITVGVDDIFNTLDEVASTARYYNQDNYYFANMENRLFRVGLKYNFGNARLRDNSKELKTDEGDRLNEE